jgi:hypothetical protein
MIIRQDCAHSLLAPVVYHKTQEVLTTSALKLWTHGMLSRAAVDVLV